MHTLNQRPLHGAVPPIGRILESKNQGVEAGVALLNIICNDPSGDLVLSVPTTLGSAGVEVLVPKGDLPLQRNIVAKFHCSIRHSSQRELWVPYIWDQQEQVSLP